MARDELTVENFERYHAANPEIYEMFKKFAFQVIRHGRSYFGPDAIIQRIRWETEIASPSYDDDGFRVNDKWTSFYSRKFSQDFPEHRDFFKRRRSAADVMMAA